MKRLAVLLMLIFALVGCGEKEESLWGDGIVSFGENSDNKAFSFQLIEQAEKITNHEIVQDKTVVEELSEYKLKDGSAAPNPYRVKGSYSWQDKVYDFEAVFSYENDKRKTANPVYYKSETGRNFKK